MSTLERYYPVIVTVEQQHVVWVEADSAEEAAESAMYDTYELLDDSETLADAGMRVEKPDAWELRTMVYGAWGNGNYSNAHNAHVDAYTWHKLATDRAACAAAGHPARELNAWGDGRDYCKTCGVVPPAATTSGEAGERSDTPKASDLGGDR